MDYTIKIGGAAGQGIQTIGMTLARVMARSGYHVYSNKDYESRVRGGHNFFQVRFSDARVFAPRSRIDMLIALDEESVPLHGPELSEGGHGIYDSESTGASTEDNRFVDIPFSSLAEEKGGREVVSNSVALGAALGMLGMDTGILELVLEESLEDKGQDVVEANRRAVEAGRSYAADNCPECSLSVQPAGGDRMVMQGDETVAFAAIASGCRFYAAYPMTPSTGILNYMAKKSEEYGLVVEQAEDEIAAINMCLGASYAGVRSMTGTSGGGFALMVEGISLAGMTETPIVIAVAQRPGPATGLPTRTEQADLLFALRAGHGEFPRVMFAPGTPEQAFRLVNRAFDITEKYQVPVIILLDQAFTDSQWTVEGIDTGSLEYEDYRLRGRRLDSLKAYRRHQLTGDGVSPLAIPGASRHLVITDSDEHDQEGHIIEDAGIRGEMVDKRLFRKMPHIRREIGEPLHYGSEEPEVVLVGWGSNYGVMREAVDSLSSDLETAMVHFSELWPFPAENDYLDTLESSRFSVCVENNASSQFAWLMKAETGYEFDALLSKYDGRPYTVEELMEGLHGTEGI